MNRKVSLYLSRVNVQLIGIPSKKNGQKSKRSFQDAVEMVPISVAEAAVEDDPSENSHGSWVKKVVGTKQMDEAAVAVSE